MKGWMTLLTERLKIKTFKVSYDCGCTYLFDIDNENELAWKPIDYTLCDSHHPNFQSSEQKVNQNG